MVNGGERDAGEIGLELALVVSADTDIQLSVR
jgi:hypothetical protein